MEILLKNAQRKHKIDTKQLKSQIKILLKVLDQNDSELSILLTRDSKIRELNREYRNQDKSTDVLSFPQDKDAMNENGQLLLGDIVISVETADQQGKRHGLSLAKEILLLTIHGLLHLLGYDHERSLKEARFMKKETRRLFKKVYPNCDLTGAAEF